MIKFITVWVLTVHGVDYGYREYGSYSYQLTYASRQICEKQKKNHERKSSNSKTARCDFQQTPVAVNK